LGGLKPGKSCRGGDTPVTPLQESTSYIRDPRTGEWKVVNPAGSVAYNCIGRDYAWGSEGAPDEPSKTRAAHDQRAEELLIHHRSRYRYVGRRGGQYELIYSIFKELNRIDHPDNRHMLWYGVVTHLTADFRRQCESPWPGIGLAEQEGVPGGAVMPVDIDDVRPLRTPAVLETIERYLYGIAGAGILLCAGEPLMPGYMGQRMDELTELLQRATERIGPFSERKDDPLVYRLVLHSATSNVLLWSAMFAREVPRCFSAVCAGDLYRERVKNPARNAIPDAGTDRWFTIADFWNGLIP